MKAATLEAKSLKMEIMPEGQELVKDIMNLTSLKGKEANNDDLAIIASDALMYYKILLEHKAKGGDVVLKLEDQEVKLPVIASI